MYEEFEGDLPNVVGYLVITQMQPNLRRVQVQMTWDIEVEGETVRTTSGKVAYLHAESEWHSH
jgi:hypothetical protein